MQPRSNRSTIIGVTAVLAVMGLVVTLVLLVNADDGFSSCTGAAEFGWLAPLLAASIIGGLAWVLLRQDPRPHDDGDATSVTECPECGRSVLGQWRMCPYCGEMLDPRYSTRMRSAQSK